ncbi:MAG: hypothetical protein ACYTFA_08210 [Planctomycetota bacterium]|jgi:ABC-type thiamin/hydroxymethylpyrimidine transport system permease subunit
MYGLIQCLLLGAIGFVFVLSVVLFGTRFFESVAAQRGAQERGNALLSEILAELRERRG